VKQPVRSDLLQNLPHRRRIRDVTAMQPHARPKHPALRPPAVVRAVDLHALLLRQKLREIRARKPRDARDQDAHNALSFK
jgi:hypothetical protein